MRGSGRFRAAASLLAVTAAPALAQQGGQEFALVPGIVVPFASPYPIGFSPRWTTSGLVMFERSQPGARIPHSQAQRSFQLTTFEGKPTFMLDGCAATLVGDTTRLGERPAIFRLENFRSSRVPTNPCSVAWKGIPKPFGGAIRLTAQPDGNIVMDVNWNVYGRDNELTDNFSVSGFVIRNAMTPVMAQRELDRREIAARERRAEAAAEAQALEAEKRAASAGDVKAMYHLGQVYEGANATEAVKWYKLAAARGSVSALFRLGVIYNDGIGNVTQSEAEAMRYFKAAALAGVPEAMYNVGLMYKTGQGAPASLTEARRWMKMAAEKGYDDAIQWLRETAF